MTHRLSVIVPTYNRCTVLTKTLEAYRRQTAADRVLELLVVDDGSTDETAKIVAQASIASPFPIRYLHQENSGLAAARNRAIQESKGQLLLFGDDDIIPAPNFVAEHLAWHDMYPDVTDAVLGYLTWSPEVSPTPFMEWLGKEGMFCFGHMQRGLLDRPAFYGGFISFKKGLLSRSGTFDEEFKAYGFEDIELGRRLLKVGMRVFYNPDAIGYHYKRISLAGYIRRAEMVEAAIPFFRAKMGSTEDPHPFQGDSAAKRIMRRLVRALLPLGSPILRLFDTHIPLPWVIYRIFCYHYILPRIRAQVRSDTKRQAQLPVVAMTRE